MIAPLAQTTFSPGPTPNASLPLRNRPMPAVSNVCAGEPGSSDREVITPHGDDPRIQDLLTSLVATPGQQADERPISILDRLGRIL